MVILDGQTMKEKFKIAILEEGILENTVLEDCHIDAEDIHAIKAENMRLMKDKLYGILVVSELGTTISAEARRLSASSDFQLNTVAKAILVRDLPQRIIGNFYLTFNKPAIRTKVFSDRDKAMEWLRSELKSTNRKPVFGAVCL